jgi:oxygen-independent coproporphyrinogen III oxidase
MTLTLAEKYGAPVPRYTSYPTAPNFHEGVDGEVYRNRLDDLADTDTLSLYIHIPFCDRLCWFCGCHTKQTLRYEPITAYLKPLFSEINLVSDAISAAPKVTAVHFGGGSPSMLTSADFRDLLDRMRDRFEFAPGTEISIEIDPADVTADRVEAMAEAGMTRASIGVQDFDPKVQEAINRPQSYELTANVVGAMRATGVGSVNLDVLYGLPHQSEKTISETIAKVIRLNPDRVALFGYAHVPWMKTHQKMIDEAALPDVNARYAQAMLASDLLVKAGYRRIGFDHFAKPFDSLSRAARTGNLRRNFQGYTDDPATALLGFGASSIGETPAGYVQNLTPTGQYKAALEVGRLPVARGFTLCPEDIARRWAIERLMCDMALSRRAMINRFGDLSVPILHDAAVLAASDVDGLFVAEGDTYRVTEKGRPFVRVLASGFDGYLQGGRGRHSAAV